MIREHTMTGRGAGEPSSAAEQVTGSRGPRRRRSGSTAVAAAVLTGLLGSGAMVWKSTAAAFTSSTSTGSNSWATGSVTLTDDDTGAAMFSATGLVPGSTGSNCITVSYTGTVATTVKLYASAAVDASSVAQYLDLTIDIGTGGGFGSCGGFSAGSTIYSGSLDAFTSTHLAYGSGVGTWAPSGAAAQVYRITYTLNAGTPNAKQGATTTATFQWEAQA